MTTWGGGDADGEHKADEGLAAAVGADFGRPLPGPPDFFPAWAEKVK